jgi:cytochrome c553
VTLRAGILALLFLASPGASHAGDPQLDYMLQCQGCHGPAGSGSGGSVPALQGQVARFLHVPGGREYLIRVPGSAQSSLDDADLAALLNWIVRRFGPADAAAQFAPFSASEVARYRPEPLVEVEPVRRELLRRIDLSAQPPKPTLRGGRPRSRSRRSRAAGRREPRGDRR